MKSKQEIKKNRSNSIFNFNHIDPNIDNLEKIQVIYQNIYCKNWIIKYQLKALKKKLLILKILQYLFLTANTISTISLNPIIIISITIILGLITLIKNQRNYESKISNLQICDIEYQIFLVILKTNMRDSKSLFIMHDFSLRLNSVEEVFLELNIDLTNEKILKKYKLKHKL